jgi:hypothetical protein
MNKEDKLTIYEINKEYVLDFNQLSNMLRGFINHLLVTSKYDKPSMKSFKLQENGSIINIQFPLKGVDVMTFDIGEEKNVVDCTECVYANLSVFVK